MLGLKLNHVSKRGHSTTVKSWMSKYIQYKTVDAPICVNLCLYKSIGADVGGFTDDFLSIK